MPRDRNSTATPFLRLLGTYAAGFLLGTAAGMFALLILASILGESPIRLIPPALGVAAVFSAVITIPTVNKFGAMQGTAKLRPHHTASVSVPSDEVFRRIADMVPRLNGRITHSDAAKGTIRVEIQRSAESFGEILTVNVSPISVGMTRLTLRSRPRMPLTFVDHGKNEENIRVLMENLKG